MNIDGIPVTVDSAAEAAALIRELRHQSGGSSPVKASIPVIEKPATAAIDPEMASVALKFLRAIRDTPNGVTAEGLMPVLGVTKPKAIGSRSASINKVLSDLGFKPAAVYDNPRTAMGRVWKPSRHFSQAISALEQRLAAH